MEARHKACVIMDALTGRSGRPEEVAHGGEAAERVTTGTAMHQSAHTQSSNITRLGSSTGPGAGPGVLPRVPTPGGRRVPHQPAVCAHGGRCRAPATVPSAALAGPVLVEGGTGGVPCASGWSPGAGRAGAAPCPVWILCRRASQTTRARMVGGAASPHQSGARTPAAARSRVAAAACVTAAAVAHARTVSNPGLFVPTVNRGVEV